MKAALFLSLSSLLGSTFALHARHAEFHNKKRDVAPLDHCCKTVVTVTVYEDEPTSTSTVWHTTTNVVVVSATGEPPISAPPVQKLAPPQEAAPSAPAPAPGIVTNGNKWAMTYTPYSTTGACKAAADVMTDVAAIKAKGFTTLRMYGTDCDGLASVGAAARATGMKMIIGVFIKGDGIGAAQPQVQQIAQWGQQGNWDLVVLIVVGNEAIHSGSCDAGALAGFIAGAKGAFQAAGSGSIPVTTTEVVDTLVANAGVLCPVIDVVAANIQSFFDGKVAAGSAGDFVAAQLQIVANACPGKQAYNLESGWPSGGGSNGASIASPEAQAAAIADIVAKVGGQTVVFSFQDDSWKAPGIEQHFGCAHLF